ncbi:MAG: hypothetical protein ILP13_04205 [Lachnospiraceae bacterium]|nr:hypothetical protein [Lachnospiraceae bacterium]
MLKILKIIGLVLLCILGIVLFAILSVLFVPIRYSGKGEYSQDKMEAAVKASWFLHLVRVSLTYGIEDPLKVRILWIDPLKKKEKKPKPEKPVKNKKKKKPEENWDEEELPEEPVTEAPKAETVTEPSAEAHSVEADTEPEITENTASFEAKEPEPKSKTKKSTQSDPKYGKIKMYIELLRSAEFKRALSLAMDSLIKVLKHILPRRWQVDADLGFSSPDTLGTVLGIVGMLYPVFHRHLNIYPNFEEEVLHVKGFFKGRITLIKLLIIGLKVLFDKDLKKVLKMFKEA